MNSMALGLQVFDITFQVGGLRFKRHVIWKAPPPKSAH